MTRTEAETAFYELQDRERIVDYLDRTPDSAQAERDAAAEAAEHARDHYRRLAEQAERRPRRWSW